MMSKIFLTLCLCFAFAAAQTIQQAADGAPCDPHDCQEEGYCTHYFTCNNDTRTWVKRECGDDLMWNDRANTEHGGVCDKISGIPADLMDKYNADPECIKPCEWWEDDDRCSGAYWYREKFNGSLNDREHQLRCPSDLKWNQDKLTCDYCRNVSDKNGNPCCSDA